LFVLFFFWVLLGGVWAAFIITSREGHWQLRGRNRGANIPEEAHTKMGVFLRGVGVVMMTGFGVLACMALVGDGVGVCVYFPRFPSGGFRLLVGVDGGGGGRVETAPAL
jgi:hypothetical protein